MLFDQPRKAQVAFTGSLFASGDCPLIEQEVLALLHAHKVAFLRMKLKAIQGMT